MLSENPLVSLFPQFFLSTARGVDWRRIQVPRMSVYAKYATMTVSGISLLDVARLRLYALIF